MFNFLLKRRYSDRRGNGQKLPRTKPSREKAYNKTPEQKPREPLREILYRGYLSGLFVLLKIGGSETCDVL